MDDRVYRVEHANDDAQPHQCDGSLEADAKRRYRHQGQDRGDQVAVPDHRPEFHGDAEADGTRSQDGPANNAKGVHPQQRHKGELPKQKG